MAALLVGIVVLVRLATILAPVAARIAAAGVGGFQLLGLGLCGFFLSHVPWDRVYLDRRAAVVEMVGVVLLCAGIAGAVPTVPNGNIGLIVFILGIGLIAIAETIRRKPKPSVAVAA